MEPITPQPSYADRLALKVCPWRGTGKDCTFVCQLCRDYSAAVAHEVATILRERYGSSATADWLDGVGCHQQEGA